MLYIASKGKLDDVPTQRVAEFESGFIAFLERERPKVLSEIATSKQLGDETTKGLDEAVDAFRKDFLA